jgi:hypothetical protein
MTQQNIVDSLRNNHGYTTSLRTVARVLQELGFSRKRMRVVRTSANCTPESKSAFKSKFLSVLDDGTDVLFLDETHFSINVLPKYGYSPKGQACRINQRGYGHAFSLIMAVSRSGRYFYKLYKGGVNIARLQTFVDHLPPVRIVMDNLRAHKSVQMSQERIFTPVAQPYANPIEIVFSKLKASFRSLNASLPGLDVEDLVDRSVVTITQSDVDNAIQHVRAYVEENY